MNEQTTVHEKNKIVRIRFVEVVGKEREKEEKNNSTQWWKDAQKGKGSWAFFLNNIKREEKI